MQNKRTYRGRNQEPKDTKDYKMWRSFIKTRVVSRPNEEKNVGHNILCKPKNIYYPFLCQQKLAVQSSIVVRATNVSVHSPTKQFFGEF